MRARAHTHVTNMWTIVFITNRGPDREHTDFVCVELFDGNVYFVYAVGDHYRHVQLNPVGTKLNDGKAYRVYVSRNDQHRFLVSSSRVVNYLLNLPYWFLSIRTNQIWISRSLISLCPDGMSNNRILCRYHMSVCHIWNNFNCRILS